MLSQKSIFARGLGYIARAIGGACGLVSTPARIREKTLEPDLRRLVKHPG